MQPQQYQPPTAPPNPGMGGPQPNYDFITNPVQPTGKKRWGGQQSTLFKIIVFGVGLLVLLIVFGIIRSALSGGNSSTTALNAVAQQQTAVAHIAGIAKDQQGIDTTTLNSANTAAVSVASSQAQLIAFSSSHGVKIDTKKLGLKIDVNVDNQLKTAVAAGTYDQTYSTVMQAQLKEYKQTLQQAYNQLSNPEGRNLLDDQFKQADLLLVQLGVN